jgi:hypothetical protein
MPIIPALKLEDEAQEDCEFKDSLGCIMRPCLKKNPNSQNKK